MGAALQNPHFVAMIKLAPVDLADNEMSADAFFRTESSLWDHLFTWQWSHVSFSDDGDFSFATEFHALLNGVNLPKNLVGADGDWMPLADLQEIFPLPSRASDGSSAPRVRAHPRHGDEPWLKDLWLWDFPDAQGAKAKSGAGKPGATAYVAAEGDSDSMGSFESADEALDALWDKRSGLFHAHPEAHSGNFRWTLLGGRWLKKTKGISYDRILAAATKGLPKQWAWQYKMGKATSWTLKTYGEDACVTLAQAWVAKNEFLFDIWWRSGASDDFDYAAADADAWPRPEGFDTLVAEAKGRLRTRVRDILNSKPARRPT